MTLKLVKDLYGNEILAKDIRNYEGKVLLRKGTLLTQEHIWELEENGVFLVHILRPLYESNYSEELIFINNTQAKYLNEFDEDPLTTITFMFNNFLIDGYEDFNEYVLGVFQLISCLLNKDYVLENLLEIKKYDNYTYLHSLDTCVMATFIGKTLTLSYVDLINLSLAALLHDIGKVKIPQNIITKKGPLTKEEFDMIKLHPSLGEEILSNIHCISACVITAVAEHHEKYNGTGYPCNLKGNNISSFGRIISICDVFTAISSKRSYRDKFHPNSAYELITSSGGTQFDPILVKQFKKTFSIYPLGCHVQLSNGLIGYVIRQNKLSLDKPVLRITHNELNEKVPPYELNLLKKTNVTIENICS